ncbi:SDR family NAD(P)-dependent oxidoreductase [Halioxenophilus aromaticivorans]|uniref:SDR family NAD(P)-dependent oxidoreductase n=1 Tax=Halioxenophilus aromaticivorans TaxID=1306992 RepID=A0AAV3U6T5_9ALTE
MHIQNKKAIVIGGASGMALATVKLLHDSGAKVAIMDLASSNGEAIAAEMGIAFQACDILDYEGLEKSLRAIAEQLGGLNIVVTTAGGGIAMRTLTKKGPHDMASFTKVLDLSLTATFNICRIAADIMKDEQPDAMGERGVLVNTASIAAFEGQIGQVAYAAAKAGVAGMILPMARDLGSLGIRVMAIAPSLFATGATQAIPEEMVGVLTKDCAFPKRMGLPEEYAMLAKSIVENPMLNGQTIRLDAGIRFGPK